MNGSFFLCHHFNNILDLCREEEVEGFNCFNFDTFKSFKVLLHIQVIHHIS